MNCCDDPKPRILESNGRVFCGTCRRYLDAPSEPLRDEEPEETSEPTPDSEEDAS